jgi:dTMP kinase
MTDPTRGLLVVFEGIDGAGKSTQIRRLALLARALGFECIESREPTYGQFGKQLRESAASGRLDRIREHELLLLDRREHVETLVAPALARGAVVLLDRYYFSSIAYQAGPQLGAAQIRADNEAFAPPPDLLLILDLAVETGLARIGARGDRPNAFEAVATLQHCREVYRGFAGEPYARLVDASQDADHVTAAASAALVLAMLARNKFQGNASLLS